MKGIWTRYRKYLWIPGIGILYYLWIRLTGLFIPCLFRTLTGWLCPGCGITTLFYCMGKGEFRSAFAANPFLFVTMPFLIFEVLFELHHKEHAHRMPRWNQILLWVYLAALFVFGVLRNVF